MKIKSIFFSVLLMGTACGASDDLLEDQGAQPADQALVDPGNTQNDQGPLGDGIQVGEDLPQLEDGTIIFRDGQRPRHRTDGHVPGDGEGPSEDKGSGPAPDVPDLTDGSGPAMDASVGDASASGDSSSVDPPVDAPTSVDAPVSLSDPGPVSSDEGPPSFDKGAILPVEDSGGVIEDIAPAIPDTPSTLVDEGSSSASDQGTVEEDIQLTPDPGTPEPGPCSSSVDCPNGVCVGGLCFYDTGGTMNCEEVVLCMAACPDGVQGCDVDCLNDGDGLAQVLYADLWLCWVTSDDFLEIAESCAGKASDCYYESEGPMNCAQAYECTFDCDGQFACVDDCLEQATSLAQTLYTGLAYCLQGACAGSNNPNCKVNNMMVGGVCHIFSDLCGNVPQPQ